jgi:L-ribulose-5-phosphate 3-epimerase
VHNQFDGTAVPFTIGSIQGRLLPKINGRTQAFPGDRWEEEFPLLNQIGYDSIELTIDTPSWRAHPMNSAGGRERLTQLSQRFGIALMGVCCDVFMERPLLTTDADIAREAESMLRDLLRNSGDLGLPFIEVPFMGENRLADDSAVTRLGRILDWALPLADQYNLDILLETDLGPSALMNLFHRFEHSRLGLNYDTGNSTWFGFDPVEELAAYHQHIRNVHIKDCTRKDYSVPLGLGETRFEVILGLLKGYGYSGSFILQAARQDDDLGAAAEYLEFTSGLLNRFFGPEAVGASS